MRWRARSELRSRSMPSLDSVQAQVLHHMLRARSSDRARERIAALRARSTDR